MKVKYLVLLLAVLVSGEVLAQQDKDTLSYPDGRYLYPPLDTSANLVIHAPNGQTPGPLLGSMTICASPGYCGNVEYSTIQPLTIYGVAFTTAGEHPVFLRTFSGQSRYTPDPPDVDSSVLDLYAVLIQKVNGSGCEMIHVDSVKWHSRRPDHYFRYRGNTASPREYVAPVFEFFFDTPIVVMDTFYVGFRSDYASSDYWDSVRSLTTSLPSDYAYHYPQQWVWELVNLGSNPPNRNKWYNEGWASARLPVASGTCTNTFMMDWGGIFPIVVPPDTDVVEEIPVLGFRKTDNYDGFPSFAWYGSSGQELYEVGYGQTDQNPDNYTVVSTTSISLVLQDSTLDSTVMYAARCRARSHHTCAIHDTLVWSEWTDTVEFYTGKYRPGSLPDDTVEVASPEENGLSRYVQLMPNPASGSVTVMSSYGIDGVEVYDVRGERVLELSGIGRVTTTGFDVSKWEKGAYVVLVRTPAGTASKRLVVN